jgi:rhodanese-related sulfurtransferase
LAGGHGGNRRDVATRVDVDRMLCLVQDGAAVIDVLPASVFAKEHVPGAVNVPLETFSADVVADMDKQSPVVLYCFDQH